MNLRLQSGPFAGMDVSVLKAKTPKNNVRWFSRFPDGANDPDRTDDLIITNDLLYQLSYVGLKTGFTILVHAAESQVSGSTLRFFIHRAAPPSPARGTPAAQDNPRAKPFATPARFSLN